MPMRAEMGCGNELSTGPFESAGWERRNDFTKCEAVALRERREFQAMSGRYSGAEYLLASQSATGRT